MASLVDVFVAFVTLVAFVPLVAFVALVIALE